MIALDARLPALLRREGRPATVSERVRLARLCQIKKLFATSAQLWDELFTAEPRLAGELNAGHRYAAACAAARAASGEGKENPPPDLATRERFRRKAREWLESDLAAITDSMAKGSPRERSIGASRLGRWLVATQLATVWRSDRPGGANRDRAPRVEGPLDQGRRSNRQNDAQNAARGPSQARRPESSGNARVLKRSGHPTAMPSPLSRRVFCRRRPGPCWAWSGPSRSGSASRCRPCYKFRSRSPTTSAKANPCNPSPPKK